MDAEIQAMDGNQMVVQVLESGNLPSLSLPSVDTRASVVTTVCHPWTLDFGIHAEMTGFGLLEYNGESSSLGIQS